jgi:hypothetical protein
MNMSSPSTETIPPIDLFAGLEIILGNEPSTNAASSSEILIGILATTFKQQNQTIGPDYEPNSVFEAILFMPLLMFQATWVNPYNTMSLDQIGTNLPDENHVSIDLAQSFSRVVIPHWVAAVYTVMSISVYLWCLGGMFAALFILTPPTTQFEQIDFASRLVVNKNDNAFVETLAQLSVGTKDETRKRLQDKGLTIRDIRTGIQGDGNKEIPYVKIWGLTMT